MVVMVAIRVIILVVVQFVGRTAFPLKPDYVGCQKMREFPGVRFNIDSPVTEMRATQVHADKVFVCMRALQLGL